MDLMLEPRTGNEILKCLGAFVSWFSSVDSNGDVQIPCIFCMMFNGRRNQETRKDDRADFVRIWKNSNEFASDFGSDWGSQVLVKWGSSILAGHGSDLPTACHRTRILSQQCTLTSLSPDCDGLYRRGRCGLKKLETVRAK